MTEKQGNEPSPEESRITRRATLLPEEEAAGSEDARHQAEAILRDSDERTDHPERTGQEPTQTPAPLE